MNECTEKMHGMLDHSPMYSTDQHRVTQAQKD